MSTPDTHTITQNDTQTPLSVTLQRDGSAVDVTGKTVKFVMETKGGAAKVTETSSNVTVTDATAGSVQYAWQAADVNTTGLFYAWFVVVDGSGNRDTYPHDGRRFLVNIVEGPRTN